MKNKKSQFKDTAKLKNIIFYIFAFVIFFVPLIVKLKVFTVPDYVSTYYPAGKTFDFFTYYKAMLLMVGVSILFPLVVYYRYKVGQKIKFDLVAKLHLAFGASILLSTLLSSYKQVAFFGFFNKNEGALTWWAYLLLSYSIYLFVESREEVTKFVKVIVASTTAISVIGLFQFFGLDYIKFDWVQRLIFGQYYEQLKASGISMIFADRTVYSTVANPNYIGSVMVLAIPLILYLISELRSRRDTIALSSLLFLHIFILAASKSTTGIIALGFVLLVYSGYKVFNGKYRKFLLVGVISTATVGGAFYFSGIMDTQIGKLKSVIDINEVTINPFKKIEIDGTKLKFTDHKGGSLVINHNEETLWVEDGDGNVLSSKINDKKLVYTDWYWSVYYVKETNNLLVYIHIDETNKDYLRQVRITSDGYTIFGKNLDNEQLKTRKNSIFKNEAFLSGRGYIWNRTVPLVWGKPFLGNGADSFVLNFPQNDLLDKSTYNILTDKPHNLFLQVAYSFGLVGLAVYLYLVLVTVINGKNTELSLSILIFMIVGITTDSAVFTSVLLFSVIGLMSIDNREDI